MKNPLTVKQLIEKLKEFDEEMPVWITEPGDVYRNSLRPAACVDESKVMHEGVIKEKCILISW